MSTATSVNVRSVDNHVLEKFVKRASEILKVSAVQAVNSEINPRVYRLRPAPLSVGGRETGPSVAQVVSEHFRALGGARRRAIRLELGRDPSITSSIRALGVDMRSKRSVTEQIDVAQAFSFLNEENFGDSALQEMVNEIISDGNRGSQLTIHESLRHELLVLESESQLRLPPSLRVSGRFQGQSAEVQEKNAALTFRVREVLCVDETDPEWLGQDEVAWGGVGVHDNGSPTKIPESFVGNFDTGDRKPYSPPRKIQTFLLGDGEYPQTYLVTLTLAEKDSEGFSEFVGNLYAAIREEIQIIINALAGVAGGILGGVIGSSGGPLGTAAGVTIGGALGTIIGIVAGLILEELVSSLVSALKDDIFQPQTSVAVLQSPHDTFPGGSLVSPASHMYFEDHGGKYRVKYDWVLSR